MTIEGLGHWRDESITSFARTSYIMFCWCFAMIWTSLLCYAMISYVMWSYVMFMMLCIVFSAILPVWHVVQTSLCRWWCRSEQKLFLSPHCHTWREMSFGVGCDVSWNVPELCWGWGTKPGTWGTWLWLPTRLLVLLRLCAKHSLVCLFLAT